RVGIPQSVAASHGWSATNKASGSFGLVWDAGCRFPFAATLPKVSEGVKEMWERKLTIPEIMLIAGTRVALGAGIGLLISTRLSEDERNGAGWALLGIGVLSSIPLIIGILSKRPIADRPMALVA